jgi:FAD/FMN-containing dehydrogenase/Fe-S oxidoreductase
MNISTDASIFEIEPKNVVYPENSDDLIKTIRDLLLDKQLFTMRAGGTSIGGQAIGKGVLVDISKHLTKIIDFREDKKEIVVEPGVIQDDLNSFLQPHNLKFAPDTSTSNRAMIGGMIGNNSCGAYSIYYGTTREHVKSVDVILSDGSVTTFKLLDEGQLRHKLTLKNLEGDIYRFILNTLSLNKLEILSAFPDESLIRRNTGYAIDELIRKYQPFNKNGKDFNLAPLICGSEGTLGVIVRATLNLVEIPKYKSLIVAQFSSEDKALKIVDGLIKFKPSAVEFIDKPTLDASKGNAEQNNNRVWIIGDPDAVLVIEFFSNLKIDLDFKVNKCQRWLKSKGAYDYRKINKENYEKVWGIRKAGLGLLMGKPGSKKAVAVIEDAAIPLKHLHTYYRKVKAIMKFYKVSAVYYGHASVGLIHIRPELDLSKDGDKQKMRMIAQDVSTLVAKYKGSLSGEHGDGRVRAPFLKEQFGQKVYQYLVDLKKTFDPNSLLNPGVIIANSDISSNLREVSAPKDNLIGGHDWGKDISFFYAAEKCSGAGACRKSAGRGVMCPSYKATRNEKFSTRGRANLLRRALNSNDPAKELESKELKEALDLCLACKACKSECPASVDMAKLKSEYLFQTQSRQDQFELWRIEHLGKILKFGSKSPRIFNFFQSLKIIKKIANINGNLPSIQHETLSNWWAINKSSYNDNVVTIWILNDIFTEYYDTDIGKDLLIFLKECGVNIKLINLDRSIIALISKGLLDQAKQTLISVQNILNDIPESDLIVGIDPSEVLVWRDEAQSLIRGKLPKVLLFEELLLKLKHKCLLPKLNALQLKVWVHVHCHQKALANNEILSQALDLIPEVEMAILNSGCCGMAGDFGYKHSKISNIIARQSLEGPLSQVNKSDIVISNGTSCRKQISTIFTQKTIHLAQLFRAAVIQK